MIPINNLDKIKLNSNSFELVQFITLCEKFSKENLQI